MSRNVADDIDDDDDTEAEGFGEEESLRSPSPMAAPKKTTNTTRLLARVVVVALTEADVVMIAYCLPC